MKVLQRTTFYVVYWSSYTSQTFSPMFLPFMKKKQKTFIGEFFLELQRILSDIIFVYKNIIHWSISKIIISVWSIVLGVLVSLPFFILACIVGLIDPIGWTSIVEYALTWTDISIEIITWMAQHPYWLVIMILIITTSIFAFLLASSYSLLLQAHLILKYIKREKLPFKKNLYFSREHISTMLGLLCWNAVYVIAPLFIWFSAILALYVLYNIAWAIPYVLFSYGTMGITLILIWVMSFVMYNILFWYTILAWEKAWKIWSSRSYLLKSIKVTSLRNFFKFILLIGIYFIIMSPFRAIDSYLERNLTMLRDAFIYKSWALENITANQREYYEYVTQEFRDLSSEQIAKKAQLMYMLQVIYFFFSYFAFGWLFIVIIVSFYKRVLKKK